MLVDTSAWIEFFKNTPRSRQFVDAIGQKPIYTCEISLAEISDWCYKSNLNSKTFFEIVQKTSTVLALRQEVLEAVGRIYNEQRKIRSKFGMMDALVAATAIAYEMQIATFDGDFQGIPGAIVLD